VARDGSGVGLTFSPAAVQHMRECRPCSAKVAKMMGYVYTGVKKEDPRPSIYADNSDLEPVPFTPESGFEEAEPAQEAVDVDSDEALRPWYSRYGPRLKRLPAADAARHAVNPQHHPAVRRAMARRARHGH
jgi:hypothetical protein